ncbi:two-component sensor histidine kinase [Paracoccus caeni]|uniref:histidine kinase n=1 Tax=Paracoccus caeni TaxID=657651 RepID=A0A934SDA7_9RHOB|nr:ATP-binding protein [Paracoccus caeni]MBK4216771.1 two-component sensor histidine kinase [Paracoccus caeni]
MIRRGSIRGRLMAALVLVVLIATGILAVGMMVMLRAERDFRALAQDRIPAVALAGELAEATGELAALAMQMVADPAMPADRMTRAIDSASQGVEGVLASPLWLAASERAQTRAGIEAAEQDLRHALTGFGRISTDLTRHAQAEARTGANLRWIHADVQDQVQGILSDLSFNMDTQLAALVVNTDPDTRAGAEQALSQDWLLRDRVQQIGSEAATLTALLLQARSADNPDALAQTGLLGRDTLDRLELAQLNLPERVDVTLLMQALERLKALASGEDSVFAQQGRRLELHRAAVAELQSAQSSLARMQALLTELGRAERIGAQGRADAAATAILRGSIWLGLLTALGAVATAVILAVFVRNRILIRIEALSADLTHIAGSDPNPPHPQGDEIAEMARAVEVFRASVQARQQALERLEMTQRELVQAGKMAALGQMSAAISHEINQPLAAIGHRLHNLRAAHPEALPAITRIEALVERITRTIGHLRRIAHRSAHRNTRVMLAEPVAAALELLDHRLRAEGVGVNCADLDGLAVAGDEILLEQVLLNILGNALDAIGARENPVQPGQIRIELRGSDPVRLVVIDNGVGLGGQSGQALTDPFVTTKEPGKGLGLGLSIAFNVMQDMGGHLEIEQHPQGGAEVWLRLNRWEEGD